MKKLVLLSCFFALFSIQTTALEPDAPAPLYQHLSEVNREWLKLKPGHDLLHVERFENDQSRIARHLELVEQFLRKGADPALDATQGIRRLRHLDVLRSYRQAGLFPANHYHPVRQPYFRDNHGVLCAVGYLLWLDGQQALVDRINRENNYGYISELARYYPEIGAWAQANGFSLAELAWIQPAYEPIKPTFSQWGNGQGLNPGGRINAMAKTANETKLIVAGSFSSIDGIPLNNIAVWDGAGWSALGDGVVGEIFALECVEDWQGGKLLVGGRFHLPGQPSQQNLAEYNFGAAAWKGLQTGDMGGAVFTIGNSMGISGFFIGGDFQKINGETHPYIGHWHPYNGGVWNYYFDYLRTDGPVNALIDIDGLLLVGGAFEQVKDATSQAWIEARHLGYFNHFGGWIPLAHNLPAVEKAAYFEGNVFVSHPFELNPNGGMQGLSILKAGLWHQAPIWPFADSTIHGFCTYGDHLMVYGGFYAGSLFGGYGTGMSYFTDDDLDMNGALLSDATIRAALAFQGLVYVAGDFEHLFGISEPFKGMARFGLPFVSSPEPDPNLAIEVTASANRLRCRYDDLEHATQLRIFDVQGHLIVEEELAPGAGETILDAHAGWANGLYVWQLQNVSAMQAGKWAVQR